MFHKAILILLLLVSTTAFTKDEFPGRKKYFNIKTVELKQLQTKFDDYIVIDARSKYEFETLHIKGAVNISINSAVFAKRLRQLRVKDKRPFVFYCNGHTCFKSYKAAAKAKAAGFALSYSFDAGIFSWSKAYPKQAVLLGQSPINPKDLITKAVFKKSLIKPLKFVNLLGRSSGILDIRDAEQRDLISLFPFNNETMISLEEKQKLNEFLSLMSRSKKPLLIYDEAGKQVRWLQYRLERANIKKYWFLKGGVKGYYKFLDAE